MHRRMSCTGARVAAIIVTGAMASFCGMLRPAALHTAVPAPDERSLLTLPNLTQDAPKIPWQPHIAEHAHCRSREQVVECL